MTWWNHTNKTQSLTCQAVSTAIVLYWLKKKCCRARTDAFRTCIRISGRAFVIKATSGTCNNNKMRNYQSRWQRNVKCMVSHALIVLVRHTTSARAWKLNNGSIWAAGNTRILSANTRTVRKKLIETSGSKHTRWNVRIKISKLLHSGIFSHEIGKLYYDLAFLTWFWSRVENCFRFLEETSRSSAWRKVRECIIARDRPSGIL